MIVGIVRLSIDRYVHMKKSTLHLMIPNLILVQFDEQLLQKGEQGGKEAAGLLWGSVRDYVTRKDSELPSDVRIVTRIYANSKGLGEVCYRAGLVDKPSMVDDFARGFTGSKQLFDYIDVGSGKDRADDKLTGNPQRTLQVLSILTDRLCLQRSSSFTSTIVTVDKSSLAAPMTMDTPDCSRNYWLISLLYNVLLFWRECLSKRS